MKVLIIEDNPGIAELISEKLIEQGFQPFAASSGNQAIECFVEIKPAIILMDYFLSDMEGQQVIHALKEKQFELPPVIIVTAQDSEYFTKELQHDNIWAYLFKGPDLMIELPKILNQLREHLNNKKNDQ
jgi:DNA-binding response OmpR family regulator